MVLSLRSSPPAILTFPPLTTPPPPTAVSSFQSLDSSSILTADSRFCILRGTEYTCLVCLPTWKVARFISRSKTSAFVGFEGRGGAAVWEGVVRGVVGGGEVDILGRGIGDVRGSDWGRGSGFYLGCYRGEVERLIMFEGQCMIVKDVEMFKSSKIKMWKKISPKNYQKILILL